MGCPFCARVRDGEYRQTEVRGVVCFEPLNPVTPGHTLFVPLSHALHSAPRYVGQTMEAAASYAGRQGGEDYNLITSSGPSATQTIEHIHVHYVPRRPDDGLHLPWTGQQH